MNKKPIDLASDNDLRLAMIAMQRAGQAACRLAQRTQTKLVVIRNGKLLELSAEEITSQSNISLINPVFQK